MRRTAVVLAAALAVSLLSSATLAAEPVPVPAAPAEICNPPCPVGTVCSERDCVATSRCTPPCRYGTYCHEGVCNPDEALMPRHIVVPEDPRAYPVGPVAPKIPPRPRPGGKGGIITGWVLAGVGLSTAIPLFILANEAGNGDCDDAGGCGGSFEAIPLYVGATIATSAAVAGTVVAVVSHTRNARRARQIRRWDAEYGHAAEVDVDITPVGMPGGGGGVVIDGRF